MYEQKTKMDGGVGGFGSQKMLIYAHGKWILSRGRECGWKKTVAVKLTQRKFTHRHMTAHTCPPPPIKTNYQAAGNVYLHTRAS